MAIALIYLAKFKHLKIPIVGGSIDKANKIMEYIVNHIGDNKQLYSGLINAFNLNEVDKLKVTVSKEALRWADGGWIYVTSIDSRSLIKEGEGVVGEGGDIVVLEEAGLIKSKEQFSKVVRMPEADRGWGKLIQSGNCIEGSVFEDAYKSPLYLKIRIDLEQAIREGRFTRDYIEDKRQQVTTKDWKRYYLVLFPALNEFTYFKPRKYDILPPLKKFYGAIDPALGDLGKSKTHKSLVGIVVLGVDEKGQAYEVYNHGREIGPSEAMTTIFNLPFIFQRFGVEAVQFQKYFLNQMDEKSKELKKYIPFEAIEQKRAKEERIESLEPYINTGQILFSGEGILWEHFQEYPELEQLDVLDTLEMAWRLVNGTGFDFEII